MLYIPSRVNAWHKFSKVKISIIEGVYILTLTQDQQGSSFGFREISVFSKLEESHNPLTNKLDACYLNLVKLSISTRIFTMSDKHLSIPLYIRDNNRHSICQCTCQDEYAEAKQLSIGSVRQQQKSQRMEYTQWVIERQRQREQDNESLFQKTLYIQCAL